MPLGSPEEQHWNNLLGDVIASGVEWVTGESLGTRCRLDVECTRQ